LRRPQPGAAPRSGALQRYTGETAHSAVRVRTFGGPQVCQDIRTSVRDPGSTRETLGASVSVPALVVLVVSIGGLARVH